jgi:hypothetical protein
MADYVDAFNGIATLVSYDYHLYRWPFTILQPHNTVNLIHSL